MSSYSSTSVSSYEPASSPSEPSTPSTSPGTSPSSPSPLKHGSSPWQSRSRESFAAAQPAHAQAQASKRNSRALTLDMRPHGIGVDPDSLVGKQLTRVRRSRAHPCITLQFSDGSAYQILVVGYDPHYRGIPKTLESDSPILNPRGSNGTTDVHLTVSHATSITLSDKAFQIRSGPKADASSTKAAPPPREDRWTQRHAAFALKFEEEQGWHCVWATMVEYDTTNKERCVFRNYADVYVDRLHPAAPSPMSAPAHVTSHDPFPAPASPGPGHQKGGSKPKRKGGKKKAGGKGRW